MNGLESLIKEYGTSLGETRGLVEELEGLLKVRKEAQPTWSFDTPQIYSMSEARNFGIELPGEGWMLKLTPGEDGPIPSMITPHGWEMTEDMTFTSPEGKKFSETGMMAELTGQEIPLYEAPWTEADIEWAEADWQKVKDVFGAVFPKEDVAAVMEFAQTEPDAFWAQIQQAGRTEDTEALLKTMIPDITEMEMEQVWGPQTTGEALQAQEALAGLTPWQKAVLGPLWASPHFWAGWGDVYTAAGGATRWLGQEGMGEKISSAGEKLQAIAPPDMLGEFNWKMMLNPRFYTTRVLRSLPFVISLIPAAIGGAYAGSSVAGAVGLGALGKLILGAIGGAALARPIESALEAGGAYDEAMNQGLSQEEADRIADEIFKKNMALTGLDAAQFALAFAPTPVRLGNKFLRYTMKGGSMVAVGLSEAGEEAYQDVVKRQAMGEDVKLDARMKEAMAIGGIFGFGLGGAGQVFSSIQERTVEDLPFDMRGQYEAANARLQEQGLSEEQARLQALDFLTEARETEIKPIVEEAVEDAKREEFQKEAEKYKPVTPEVTKGIPKEGTLEAAARAKMEAEMPEVMARVREREKGITPKARAMAKDAWALTLDQYIAKYGRKGQDIGIQRAFFSLNHRRIIEQALSEGKPVTAEVLADYPDLAPAIPKAKAVTPEVTPEWRYIPTVKYTELNKGMTLVDQAGDRWLIKAIDKTGVPAKWAYTLENLATKQEWKRSFTEVERYLKVEGAPAIPKAPSGTPEAGFQPSMLKGVPGKAVRPAPAGHVVQAKLDDYLKLHEYKAEAAKGRIAEIKGILAKEGRLPKGMGTRAEAEKELARLEAQQELEAMGSLRNLDFAIEQIGIELGTRAMPYHGRAENLFPEYTTAQLDEIIKIYEEARARIEPVVEIEVTAEGIPIFSDPWITSRLTNQQIEATLDLFKQALVATTTTEQRAATIELRKHALALRARSAEAWVKELIVEGLEPSAAIKMANERFLSGELPGVTTDVYNDLSIEMVRVLEAKVYNYWVGKDYFELTSTMTALTNALRGESIPRKKGTGTKYFPEGGSAWDRLSKVFADQTEILEALDTARPVYAIIEGLIIESGRRPLPLNQETVDYLKKLSTLTKAQRTILEKPLAQLTEQDIMIIARQEYYRRQAELNALRFEGTITKEEYNLELRIAKDKVYPYAPMGAMKKYPPATMFGLPRLGEQGYTPPKLEPVTAEEIEQKTLELRLELAEKPTPITPFEAPISEAFEQLPLLKIAEKRTIVRVLKELRMLPIDIGNLIRANKASFDMSFWRQQKTLTIGHPVSFYRANVEAWKALFSQKSAEANWEWIRRRPSYHYYAEMMERTGHDFLRPLELKKGTSQWRGVEEFGYITGERAIPRMTGKIPWVKVSARAFIVGTNTHNMLIYDKCLEATMRRAEKIAAGEIKLKEGEAFDIQKEMDDYATYIGDMTQRAHLGKAAPLAPALGAMFFAPRSKLGRLLTPRHLLSKNPRVRALAWKDLSLFVGTFSGLVMIGFWLGLWDVERDSRNAQFMSIRIGNMRIDPWGGHRQFLVLYSRIITGTGVSSVTGQEYEVNPVAALTTFFRTSLSPMTSIIMDFWTGKNFLGEDVTVKDKRQWLERISPFSVWDVWEAYENDWLHGAIALLPAIFGEGVQTYSGDWTENWAKLGLPKYQENTAYGITEPVYDLADFWADHAGEFRGVDPETLTESKGYPEYVRSLASALQVIETINDLPNQSLTSLNADPSKGATFVDYYQMWQDRQKIVASGDEEKLKEFDADERTRNAHLGNMTQRQYALLVEYHTLSEDQQGEFLAQHPEVGVNPREEWLKAHPDNNALLALWGKAKIQSLEVYNATKKLLADLDVPDNAIPKLTLPPEGSVENYFKYMETGEELGWSSWEVRLLLLEDDQLREWLGREPLDDNIESLKLQIKHRPLTKEYEGYSDKDSEYYIEDKDARSMARELFRDNHPDWVEDMNRVDAYKLDFPEEQIENYAEYYSLPEKGYHRERYLLENPDFYNSMVALKDIVPFDTGYKVPDARYDEIYDEYEELFEAYEDVTGTESERADKREQILRDNPTFARARREREAYKLFLPEDLVDDYADWFIDSPKKADDSWFQQKGNENETFYGDQWWLMDHPEFVQAMIDSGAWKADAAFLDFSKVPTKQVFNLYKSYKGQPRGKPRLDFRAKHRDLDEWLFLAGEVTELVGNKGKKEAPKTPWEKAEEAKRIKEWIESL